jgi:VanZ family protein
MYWVRLPVDLFSSKIFLRNIIKKVPFIGTFSFFLHEETYMKLLKKYFAKLYIAISWTLIVLILLSLPGKMLPNEPAFKIPNLDKVVHICLFGGFVLLWCLYAGTRRLSQKKLLEYFFYIFIIGVTIGISMEYVQKYFIPNRDFELGDIIADMIGAGLAYGIANVTLVVENSSH